MNKITNNILKKLKKEDEFSPFLFIGKNLEILNNEIKNISFKILETYNIPKVFLYVFEDNSEKIKVKEIREFTEKSNIKTSYKFQIFFIENISRMTIQASNSLLKFLEEPGKQNLIFLSNSGENNILETILSRVQIINLGLTEKKSGNLFFKDLLKNYLEEKDTELVSYFFRNKLEKREYLDFLEEIIIYFKKSLKFIEHLDELLEDINLIEKNNINARFIVDKWIFKIGF